MPAFAQFSTADAFYSVLAHELVHWTGAPARLYRNLSSRFGSDAYAMEELIAELGAAFILFHLGLNGEPRRDHAAYISSWLQVLRRDCRAIGAAASKAQAAADHLIAMADREERSTLTAGPETAAFSSWLTKSRPTT